MSAVPVQLTLFDYEREIERALETVEQAWITIADSLRAIHERGLYKAQYGTWARYCRERWGKTRQWGYYLVESAEVIENVNDRLHGVALPDNEWQVRPLLGLSPEEQVGAWEESIRRFEKPTGDQVARVVAERKARVEFGLASHQLINASTNNEWYTPAPYLDAVHEVLGGIDVDPASNDLANRSVRAALYYTDDTDGFTKEWPGRVFLNPPYGHEDGDSNQARWTGRLLDQYEAGITAEAILLVNAVTDRSWFAPLWDYRICFVRQRIRFYNAEIDAGQPTHGNVFVYFGPRPWRFEDVFKRFGPVVREVVRDVG